MSKLELTLNPNYVKDWTIHDAIRELIQNALDGEDEGFKMEIKYQPERKKPVLSIINHKALLNRNTLLLGSTSKRDSNARGYFGEGYKLALLVLLRNNLEVWIKSGSEKWIPSIEYSENYKSDLLTMNINKASYENLVKIEVRGLEESDWKIVQSRVLLPFGNEIAPQEKVNTDFGDILLKEECRGQLYVKDLWVSNLYGDYWFGYNFKDLKLDRDRKVADEWDIKREIRSTLNDACEKELISNEDLWTLLNGDRWAEATLLSESYSMYTVPILANKIVETFHLKYGNDAVAVTDMTESAEAHHYGIKGIVTSRAIKALIEYREGEYKEKRDKKAYDIQKSYSFGELNDVEKNNLIWATKLLTDIEEPNPFNIVDFMDDKIMGLYSSKEIRINKKILEDKQELIATLVHEISHRAGGDGTIEHSRECEKLFGKLITSLTP